MEHQWDAIIINFNGGLFLDPCLRALTGTTHPPTRIIVVDNASSDDSINELAGWPQAEVISLPENLGYAGGANRGVETSEAPIVVLLNPDVELDADFGRNLINVFSRDDELGVAGAKLRYPESGLIQHAGGRINWPELTTAHYGENEPDHAQFDAPRDVDYVTGAAMAISRDAFEAVGGFDERFFPAYWEDVDFCARVRNAGWSVRYQPELTGVHYEGAGKERGDEYFMAWTRNRLRFAVTHLSASQWWQEFVPAEVERLRGEVSAIETPDWLVRSGGVSIEQLARLAGAIPDTYAAPVSQSEPLLSSIHAVRELPTLADPAPPPLGPSDGVIRRVKRFLGRFSGRLYAEELYWRQRQFNDSVVRAFRAQDRLNRELVVEIIFTMLLIGQQKKVDSSSTYQGKADPE